MEDNSWERIELPLAPSEKIVLGVISDTHIPDRGARLHPAVIPALKAAGVSAILHAGDVAVPSVLAELGQVARVIAVQGNRDWLFRQNLPMACILSVGSVQIGLAHGHGGWRRYFIDKLQHFFEGYQSRRYHQELRKLFPEARAIIYGHTHHVDVTCQDGCLYFNPGAAGSPSNPRRDRVSDSSTSDPESKSWQRCAI